MVCLRMLFVQVQKPCLNPRAVRGPLMGRIKFLSSTRCLRKEKLNITSTLHVIHDAYGVTSCSVQEHLIVESVQYLVLEVVQ